MKRNWLCVVALALGGSSLYWLRCGRMKTLKKRPLVNPTAPPR